MTRLLPTAGLLVALVLSLCACAAGVRATPSTAMTQETDTVEATRAISEAQARDLAWRALEPNTSSHDPANWEVIDLRQVEGQAIVGEFEGQPAPGCPGPTPEPNAAIDGSGTYWLVRFQKRPATPPPAETPLSLTAPPNVPEPFMYQASLLLHPGSGEVVARRFLCVIY